MGLARKPLKRAIVIAPAAAMLLTGLLDLGVVLPLRFSGDIGAAWQAANPLQTLVLLAFWLVPSVLVTWLQVRWLARPALGIDQPFSWWRTVKSSLVSVAAIGLFSLLPVWAAAVRLTTQDASGSNPLAASIAGYYSWPGILAGAFALAMHLVGLVSERQHTKRNRPATSAA